MTDRVTRAKSLRPPNLTLFPSRPSSRRSSVPGLHIRPCNNFDSAIGHSLQRGRVMPEQFSPPPHSSGSLLRHRGEPVLPDQCPNLARRRLRKRIAGKQIKDVLVIRQEQNFRIRHDRIVTPRSQRSKPQIPIKPWLVGSVDSRRRVEFLRLVSKAIGHPILPVVRTLELNFVASSHHGKEAISIGDAKGL